MATQCMNPEPHDSHVWAIASEVPGEPDVFLCDGVRPASGYVSPFKPVGHDGPCHDTRITEHDRLVAHTMQRLLGLNPDQLQRLSTHLDEIEGNG